jgi:hypothetical protein
MTTYRWCIGLGLALVMCASLPDTAAHAAEHGHSGGEHSGGEHSGGPWHGHEHHWDGRPGWGWHGEWGWHGMDGGRWHGGHWIHGVHLGRLGWWWVVGDGWYFYPAPVYPYPDPYVPPAVVAPQAGYWYYCPRASAYYPYVTECPGGWTPVTPQAPAS